MGVLSCWTLPLGVPIVYSVRSAPALWSSVVPHAIIAGAGGVTGVANVGAPSGNVPCGASWAAGGWGVSLDDRRAVRRPPLPSNILLTSLMRSLLATRAWRVSAPSALIACRPPSTFAKLVFKKAMSSPKVSALFASTSTSACAPGVRP